MHFLKKAGVGLLGAGAAAGLAGAGLALFTARIARRVEHTFPPQGRFLEANGARVHVIEQDAGQEAGRRRAEGRPPIVFVHGLGGHAFTFTYAMAPRLAERFQVFVVERPGSGYSTRPPGHSAALGAQADTLAAVIEALDLGQPPLLVGHSLGGAVALALAVRRPDLAGGLALIAPLTHVQDEVPEAFARMTIRSPWLRQLAAWTVATPLALLQREAVLGTLFGPDDVPDDYATAGGGPMGLRPAAFYGASTDLVATNRDLPGLVARYGELQGPVGILFGTGDRVLDHKVHGIAAARAIPGVDLRLVDGGHMLPLTAPGEAVALVEDVAARMNAHRNGVAAS